MKRILFSCIGNTDPMNRKNFSDGPMLHIVRYYKPDIIYLFLSKEMAVHHEKENRYKPYIEKLTESLGYSAEINWIIKEDLLEPHLFDTLLFEDLRKEIEKIHFEYSDAEIILNVSSGTPAMKSSLLVLNAFFDFKTRVIQVASPSPGTHDTPKRCDKDEWDTLWQLNEDNNRNINRCREIENKNLNFEIKREIIKNSINRYDI
ncbi:MAG: type III-A CRISPR-associated CARF protein Csm6 [Peptoniphilaceae bacterium]